MIDKPANLPVHPAGRYFYNTLLIHLKTKGFKESSEFETEDDFFLPHRIDKETSGILVIAKDKVTCAALTRQFAERTTQKRYLAIVHGKTQAEFSVNLALSKNNDSAIFLKMAVLPEAEGGLPSLTNFRTTDTRQINGKDFSLVECLPKTGRQHQIRLHLSAIGHPIVGDKLYSLDEKEAIYFFERPVKNTDDQEDDEEIESLPVRPMKPELEAKLILPRQALHAAGLSFVHPATGEKIEFNAELPEDLKQFFYR